MDLAAIQQAFAARRTGHSLPAALYNDPAVFAFDLAAVFARSWLMAGFECEVPEPGSYSAIHVGPWPVLLVRGRDGEVRAFHNSCRHRGAMLCKPGAGRTPKLVCPYHRWTYGLDGALQSAARMPADFDATAYGLLPIRVESVAGVLYICLAGEDAPPFETFRHEMTALLAPHNLADAKVARTETLTEYANWKLVIENGRECYHCQASHPELAKTFPVNAASYFEFGGAQHAAEFEARMAALGLPTHPAREEDWWQAMRFPLNPGMTSMTMDGAPAVRRLMCEVGDGDIGSLRWALEPHSFAHATGELLFFFSAMPVNARETLVTAKWLVHKDAVEGVDYDSTALVELWNTTNLQDKELAENNQAGIDSPGYVPGPYSPEAEALVLRFVDWYCAKAQSYLDGHAGRSATVLPHAA